MNNLIKYIFSLFLILTPGLLMAQDVEMADQFRADGKIYVVVLVMSVIFAGIVAYLVFLDLKLRKMEKELKDK